MNTGGPAYPQHGWSNDPKVLERMKTQGGMTLLDWMAGQALVGLLACPAGSGCAEGNADAAYDYATAMLAEKSRREAEVEPITSAAEFDPVELSEADRLKMQIYRLESLNRKLVEALEACEYAFSKFAPQEESAYGMAWIKVRTAIAKAKGVA